MSSNLRRSAVKAITGEDRSPDALNHACDFLDDALLKVHLDPNDNDQFDLFIFLSALRSAFDRGGESSYRLEVINRNNTGRPPDLQQQRHQEWQAFNAAVIAELLHEQGHQQKYAVGTAVEKTGISQKRLYGARRSQMFTQWKMHRADKLSETGGVSEKP